MSIFLKLNYIESMSLFLMFGASEDIQSDCRMDNLPDLF